MSKPGAARAVGRTVERIVSLWLVLRTTVDLDRVPEVVGLPTAPWLGEPAPEASAAERSFLCDLELHAGGSERVLFRKAALVSFGEPFRADGGWVVPIEWRAATLSPLFPVFVGTLRIDAEQIVLDGRYAPPGGTIGYLLDSALLGAAARQTGHWFLRKLAAELP